MAKREWPYLNLFISYSSYLVGVYMKINQSILLIAIICLASLSFAESTPENITTAMCAFYNTMKGALAVGMMLLVVLAAIVYAVGQMLGAETRARASVWATAMFVGALVGALIYIIMPFILDALMAPDTVTTACIANPAAPS